MILTATRISLKSVRYARAGRRFIQTGAGSAEAYLEPVHDRPGITSLLLNRPKAKNAISLRLLKELQECLDTVQFDKRSVVRLRVPPLPAHTCVTLHPPSYPAIRNSTRVLIVRSSTPGSFCAGADLIERASMSKAQVDRFLIDLRRALGTLENLPVPTVAAVDGPALGGGLEMALACDLRVADRPARDQAGDHPWRGGTQRLTRLLGVAKAKNLIFTARTLSAQEAMDFGVVDYVSDPDSSAYDRALQLAQEISANAPLALRAAKQAISRVPDVGFESGLDFERASYEPLLHSQDRLEALQAFKEKRAPIFKGE
ncbi:ClpP/crotonase [Daedaleopsis nitida]|nr:ClpP/crotonase [Daedaleopsis nitida]